MEDLVSHLKQNKALPDTPSQGHKQLAILCRSFCYVWSQKDTCLYVSPVKSSSEEVSTAPVFR